MVSNAELHKLITNFQEQFNKTCDDLKKDGNEGRRELSEKLDAFGERLDIVDKRLDKIEESHLVFTNKFEEINRNNETTVKVTDDHEVRIQDLERRLLAEEKQNSEDFRQLREENDKLKEEIENATNRQLRRTLIFRNIPETKDDESYPEVKELLARTIGSNTDMSYEEILVGIDRAHREPKRDGGSREGKRTIFAAFTTWELAQKIIEQVRQRCINDRTFQITADQMYGPLTTRRRNLAYQTRKTLKARGTISGGFVDFPARLMVNFTGDVAQNGKKVYKLHTNFSKEKV